MGGSQILQKGKDGVDWVLATLGQSPYFKTASDQSEIESEQETGSEGAAVLNHSKHKFALVICLNYEGSKSQLNGTDDDAKQMREFLEERDFHVTFMNDGGKQIKPRSLIRSPNHPLYATKTKVIQQIRILIKQAKDYIQRNKGNVNAPKPVLFLNYAGHGCTSKSNAEQDGTAESMSLAGHGYLKDSDLTDNFANKIPHGAEAFAVFDCCHSATMMDLPYSWDGGWKRSSNSSSVAKSHTSKKSSPGPLFYLSGCQDTQTSKDLGIGGVMSMMFKKVINKGGDDYKIGKFLNELRNAINAQLARVTNSSGMDMSQKPGLSSNHDAGANITFKSMIDGV